MGNRDTCSVLAPYEVRDYAKLIGAKYGVAWVDSDVRDAVRAGIKATRAGRPAVLEVAIDSSRKTFFTKGMVTTNLLRLPWSERLRTFGRLIGRKVGR